MLSLAAKLAGTRRRVAGLAGFVLHTAAARVGGLDLGFVPGEGGMDAATMARPARSTSCSCSAPTRSTVAPGAFVVYQGTHGDRGAHRADVILPGAAYTEKSGLYVNTEGRVQRAERANFPPGDAREDWAILRALSDVLGPSPAVRLRSPGCEPSSTPRTRHLASVDQIADRSDRCACQPRRRSDRAA